MKTAVEWMVEKLFRPMDNPPIENVSDIIQQAKEMEREQKHKSIDKQVGILKNTLEEMMTRFDSEEDRMDFILDIFNGYRKRINL